MKWNPYNGLQNSEILSDRKEETSKRIVSNRTLKKKQLTLTKIEALPSIPVANSETNVRKNDTETLSRLNPVMREKYNFHAIPRLPDQSLRRRKHTSEMRTKLMNETSCKNSPTNFSHLMSPDTLFNNPPPCFHSNDSLIQPPNSRCPAFFPFLLPFAPILPPQLPNFYWLDTFVPNHFNPIISPQSHSTTFKNIFPTFDKFPSNFWRF